MYSTVWVARGHKLKEMSRPCMGEWEYVKAVTCPLRSMAVIRLSYRLLEWQNWNLPHPASPL